MLTGRKICAANLLGAVMRYGRFRFQRVDTVICFIIVECTHKNNVTSMHRGSICDLYMG